MAEKEPVKKGPQAPKVAVDISILDDGAKEKLRARAKAKVDKERVAAAEAELLAQYEKEERQAGGLEEELETVLIDLAPYADKITLDGVIYFQGQTRTVRKSVAAVINEICARTWAHQSIVDGKSEDFYRKGRGQRVVPLGNGGAGVTNILRA
jgi:hypothetical protein